MSPQYHRTCALSWSRYLHRLKADALQENGAKAQKDGVCEQRHQTDDRKKKLFSCVSLRLLLQPNQSFSTERPPLTRPHGRCQLQVEPHAAISTLQRRSCLSRLRDPANTTGEVDDRWGGKGRGQAGGSLMEGGLCAVLWRR